MQTDDTIQQDREPIEAMRVMREALQAGIPWLAKAIGDKCFDDTALPRAAHVALDQMELAADIDVERVRASSVAGEWALVDMVDAWLILNVVDREADDEKPGRILARCRVALTQRIVNRLRKYDAFTANCEICEVLHRAHCAGLMEGMERMRAILKA